MNGVAAAEGALPLARSRLDRAMSPDYAITLLREHLLTTHIEMARSRIPAHESGTA
jgi:hypothetical protein